MILVAMPHQANLLTSQNAHPHHNADKSLFVVHNGIIENYLQLRSELEAEGYEFISETDTEVIAHYFDRSIKQGHSIPVTISNFFKCAQGTYAVLIIQQGTDELYAFCKDSPLVLGIGKGYNIVSSNIYAFNNSTTDAVFFEDYQYAHITDKEFTMFDSNGEKTSYTVTAVEETEEESQEDHDHYMIKEIKEQPLVAARLLSSLQTGQLSSFNKVSNMIANAKKVAIVACGTSHHAGLVARSSFIAHGVPVQSYIASEFDDIVFVDEDTLVIAISQSGETMDVITTLKAAKKLGAKVVSITNTSHSTIERLSNASLNIVAGQEVAVASTKAFTNQVMLLLSIAGITLGGDAPNALRNVPEAISQTIENTVDTIKEIAAMLAEHQHIYFIGRKMLFPIALEMALKLKEISYIHADGMMAAELKHGPISLIDKDQKTPVVVLEYDNDLHMRSSEQEVRARGANTVVISNTKGDIVIPAKNEMEFAICASVVGQLLAYYVALDLGHNIDQPRNLAKSVTVG